MIELDFIPAEYHRRRLERRRWRRYGLLLALLVTVMGAWNFAQAEATRRIARQLAEVHRQHEQVRIHRVGLERLIAERDSLRSRQGVVGRLGRTVAMDVVLAELSRLVPPSVTIRELAFDRWAAISPATAAPGVPPTTRPANGRRSGFLRLVGVATDESAVSDLAAALAGSPWFADVTAQPQQAAEGVLSGRVVFETTCRVQLHEGSRR